MTKKDYIMFAKILNEVNSYPQVSREVRDAVEFIAGELANELQRENDRFDRARFLKACGVES